MSIPGVIVKSKFLISSSSKFKSYIDYINREEAVRNNSYSRYSLYNDYMGNPTKTSALFNLESDFMNNADKNNSKKVFEKAQKNNSIMWQDVYSFDNKWLEKHDLYNPVTHELDEVKIKNAVRKSIGFVLDKDNLSDSAIWNGAIHYNTDNIHIHVAICEPEPTRQRGKRTQKTLDIMKSKFINELLNTKDLYKEINKNIREDIVDTKKDFSCSNDKEMKKLLKKAIKSLPKDKRHWHYGYNTMSESNKHIDEITKYYINKYKKNEFETLCKNLDKQEELLKETYGVGEREKYKDYKQNKIDELYKRMGNTIIKEMKENIELKSNKNMKNLLPNLNLKISKADIKKIEKSLSNDIDSYKNISLYEKLQQQIEHEL